MLNKCFRIVIEKSRTFLFNLSFAVKYIYFCIQIFTVKYIKVQAR
jgi:hypothetical protein